MPAGDLEHVPMDDVAAAHVRDQVLLDQFGKHRGVRCGIAGGRVVAQVRAQRGHAAAHHRVALRAFVGTGAHLASELVKAFPGVEDGDGAGGSGADDTLRARLGRSMALAAFLDGPWGFGPLVVAVAVVVVHVPAFRSLVDPALRGEARGPLSWGRGPVPGAARRRVTPRACGRRRPATQDTGPLPGRKR